MVGRLFNLKVLSEVVVVLHGYGLALSSNDGSWQDRLALLALKKQIELGFNLVHSLVEVFGAFDLPLSFLHKLGTKRRLVTVLARLDVF